MASARLKADGDAGRIVLLLTAKAAREIVKAIEANTEIVKGITREAREMKDTLKGAKRKADGQTEA